MKIGALITAIIAVLAIGGGTYAFLAGSNPYLTAKEARQRPGVSCNVAGDLLHQSVRSNLSAGKLEFQIKDTDGELLPVVYNGPKPGNFDTAPRVSVLGAYENGSFHAERILVKCPSKYENKGS